MNICGIDCQKKKYEYLPIFCFICGIIGHVDRECSIKLKRGEEPQFGKWLKWLPPRRIPREETRRSWVEGGGRRQYNLGSGGSKSGSDAPSWRKDGNIPRILDKTFDGDGQLGSSHPKIMEGSERVEKEVGPAAEDKVQFQEDYQPKSDDLPQQVNIEGDKSVENIPKPMSIDSSLAATEEDTNTKLQKVSSQLESSATANTNGENARDVVGQRNGKEKNGRYKKLKRDGNTEHKGDQKVCGKKRGGDEMEVDGQSNKKEG
jgi:hypothetical protein